MCKLDGGFQAYAATLLSKASLMSLKIRQLIFRNYSLVRLAFNAVSKSSICLDRHTLNDGVNHWWINRGTTLRTLR
jgi:hypothetical protein